MKGKLEMEASNTSYAEFKDILGKACKAAMPRGAKYSKRLPAYWWTEEIAVQRRLCIAARRRVTRERRKGEEQSRAASVTYKAEERKLKSLIRLEKARGWEKLCDEVEEDTWGKGYRIVKGRLGQKPLKAAPELVERTILQLFPKDGNIAWLREPVDDDIKRITPAELRNACAKMKNKKAPGIDGLGAEVVRILADEVGDHLAGAMTQLLQLGEFPAEWKRARLVLIKKPGRKGEDPSSYRPICLIDVLGKVYERIIANRLKEELAEKGDLSESQYGFRTGRSTLQPIQEIVRMTKWEKEKRQKHRQICALITLDVKNAFNTARWGLIIKALHDKGISAGLINVVKSYLEDRMIVDEHNREYQVTRGVPQGSVLGPLLWNVLYDGVLKLQVERGVKLVAFADDLAVMVRAKNQQGLEMKANNTVRQIVDWMLSNGLQLAAEKTEMVILSGHRSAKLVVRVGDSLIRPSKSIKYLGLIMGRNLSFREHIQYAVGKGMAIVNQVGRLLPRVRGAGEKKRRLLMAVGQSTVLYGCGIWQEATKLTAARNKLKALDRAMAIRVCRAYRTVSWECSLVLARCFPLSLLVKERIAAKGKPLSERKRLRKETLLSLQREWCKGKSWTRDLIKNLGEWYGREHGEVNFHLAQVLSGHGCFQAYLEKIGKVENGTCWYCSQRDDAEHTLFGCEKWSELRRTTSKKVGCILTRDNIIRVMLRDAASWDSVADMVGKIMLHKEEEARRRSARNTLG